LIYLELAFLCAKFFILDSAGVKLGLWMYMYLYDVFPFIPGYIPWDLTLLPLSMMFMIEIKHQLSPQLKAIIYGLLVHL